MKAGFVSAKTKEIVATCSIASIPPQGMLVEFGDVTYKVGEMLYITSVNKLGVLLDEFDSEAFNVEYVLSLVKRP